VGLDGPFLWTGQHVRYGVVLQFNSTSNVRECPACHLAGRGHFLSEPRGRIGGECASAHPLLVRASCRLRCLFRVLEVFVKCRVDIMFFDSHGEIWYDDWSPVCRVRGRVDIEYEEK
jgi:hypothetical protein